MAHRKVFGRGVYRLILTLFTCTLCHTDTEATACGGVFTSPEGVITSPGYPGSYPHQQDCVYIIKRPQGQKVILSFLEIDLEDQDFCGFDFVEIRDGDLESSPYRKRFCGSALPSKLKSFSSALWIRFGSDETNTAGGFKISYISAVAEPNNFFLLAQLEKILIRHPDEGGSMLLPLPGVDFPLAVDFDPVQDRVYWTDVIIREIRSVFLNGTGLKTVLALKKDAIPVSMAIDPVSRLLYYMEIEGGFIGVVSMVSLTHKTVITGLLWPFSIALDNTEGVIFWIDRGSKSVSPRISRSIDRGSKSVSPKISRSRYDGSERKEIVTSHLFSPTSLAVDKATKRLYWVDSESQMIEWSDYEGQGRRGQISHLKNTDFFALALTDSRLHIVDWGQITKYGDRKKSEQMPHTTKSEDTILLQAEKDGSNITFTEVYEKTGLRDIHFHNDTQWKKESNGCSTKSSDCSHMCVPLPDMGHRCMCPDKQVLAADRKTCRQRTASPETPFPSTKTGGTSKTATDRDIKNLKTDSATSAHPSHFSTAGNDEEDDFWEEEDDDDWEEEKADKKMTTDVKYTRASYFSVPESMAANRPSHVNRKELIVISKHDYLHKTVTAFASLTGPRPFDTDGTKLMTLTCISSSEYLMGHLWYDVDCIEHDADEEGGYCVIKPKVPEDDKLPVGCAAYYYDGRYGLSSVFTLDLNYPPSVPPEITGYNNEQVLEIGDLLRMTCTVKGGKPLVSAIDFYCPGHPDTEPDEEGRTEVHATVTIRRLTSSDNGVTCVCSAEWKVPEMYTKKAYVTLRVAADVRKRRGGEL